ncbi:ABC transporter ATP-binding protein [Eubacterium oxidoreducens]|uniref:Energy-coupling factor transport system ATP-binding protein n=1 Tax=Eubacterium oxidoreducens TaxID=1732 RepID=A0A1G6AAF0_EUBOX|nr:ATP-binding cassette domain-containing protein [Eubacterium oxidoreducens]SDB05280.1 energy-coupling factor transport system ATP-binding protein [Eubacterium oxidoreducens]
MKNQTEKRIYQIENFSFYYPECETPAIAELSMNIKEGAFHVLCGPSGCGKSTLLRQLKPTIKPHGTAKGIIRYDGAPIGELGARRESSEIGYVLQNPDNQIVTDKVWHELAFGLESLGYDTQTIRLRVAEMASYFGIESWFRKDVSELSGGQKQLLNLASIMAMHPKVLILDEPTAQLDPIAASDFLETVRKLNRDLGTTIIITEHRLQDIIPYADRVFVMEEGKILCQGSPRDVGSSLKKQHSGSFLAMPIPMQIYSEVDNVLECPLTVNEGRAWLDALLDGCENAKMVVQDEKEDKKTDPIIEVKDVWFRYEKDGPDVVKNLNLTVNRGEFYAILGGNGTGKSTTLSLISHLRTPYRGKILIEGRNIRKYSEMELYRGLMGVLPQSPQAMFLKKTVKEDLYAMLGGQRENAKEYDLPMEKSKAIEGIASLTRLTPLYHRHPYDLSGGEQQRLALAKVLLLRPKILLLDEPTKGLDAEYKKFLGELLGKLVSKGITILMVSHDMEFVAEYADRVGLFFEGNLVTQRKTAQFFAGNNFYTTAANRMARHVFPEAVTGKDVIACLKKNS